MDVARTTRPGRRLLGLVALAAALSACRGKTAEPKPAIGAEALPMLTHYADLAFAEYTDSAAGLRDLRAAVDAFLAAPSEAGLRAARAAWLSSRVPYEQTEPFRFYGGPIDRVERLVNTWPIDEELIDSKGAAPGIVNDATRFPELTTSLLESLNMKEGETSVTTGYHAVEYLLWGADTDPKGPGNRPFTDYAGSPEAVRRGLYLRLATDLLEKHVSSVAAEWSKDTPDGYRARFLAMPPREAVGLVIKGMGSFTGPELSGERLTVAYATKDQENEHSCFSDSTRDDIAHGAAGIRNLGVGKYVRRDGSVVQGPGLVSVLERSDPELARRLAALLDASVAAAKSIPSPFDQAILGKDDAPGRRAVQATITALEAQAATLTRVASSLGAAMPLTAQVP